MKTTKNSLRLFAAMAILAVASFSVKAQAPAKNATVGQTEIAKLRNQIKELTAGNALVQQISPNLIPSITPSSATSNG